MSPGDQIEAISLSGRHPYLLSQLTIPHVLFSVRSHSFREGMGCMHHLLDALDASENAALTYPK